MEQSLTVHQLRDGMFKSKFASHKTSPSVCVCVFPLLTVYPPHLLWPWRGDTNSRNKPIRCTSSGRQHTNNKSGDYQFFLVHICHFNELPDGGSGHKTRGDVKHTHTHAETKKYQCTSLGKYLLT